MSLIDLFPSYSPAAVDLTDSHCHLDFSDFDDDRDIVMQRAMARGVQRFLVPGVKSATWPRLAQLRQQYASWQIAFGLHPYFIEQHGESDLEQLPHWLQQGAIAVGEIGLDAHVGDMAKQKRLFDAQLMIAAEFRLPVILHHRKTLDTMLPLVRKATICGGIVHAFSGSYQQAMAWIELGFRLGVGGVITYPRAQKTRQTIARLPAQSLVLETDSPDMPLCGFQGQRNEPERVRLVYDALRTLRNE
ncbi:MAG: TatD family hydrolase [Aliidiomarina sp.]|uniref:TatD family hydrolase n=1 Tax=Aliidiomarina sp. TaxID=1872439 RepID=UPI0025C6D6B3|nr:TatD family hydrolase [Aliidiomarina sp.]MCH8501455.1 TatD family hydrolase [Aliidiomarina sp.]